MKDIKRKAQTKRQAVTILKQLNAIGKSRVEIWKFATKRKYQFFVGDWWEWLAQIS